MDLAKAHVAAIDRLVYGKAKSLEIYNVSTGTLVLEVVQAFEQATGQSFDYTLGRRRAGDVPKVYAAVTKAK